MWIKIRLLAMVITPFLLGFFWGQAADSAHPSDASIVQEEALEAAYAEGWREGSRYVVTRYRVDRE